MRCSWTQGENSRKGTTLINKDGGKHRRILCETDTWFRYEKIFKWSGCQEGVKHSESRLQPRESTVILLTSVQFISSQSKRSQMYMTHYCSYEEMSDWAGSCRGEYKTEHLTLLDSCLLCPRHPWRKSMGRVELQTPRSVPLLCLFPAGGLGAGTSADPAAGLSQLPPLLVVFSCAAEKHSSVHTGTAFIASALPSLRGALLLASTDRRVLLRSAGQPRAEGGGSGAQQRARIQTGLRPPPGGADPAPGTHRHGKGAALEPCPLLSSRLTPPKASPKYKVAHFRYIKKTSFQHQI